MIHQKLVPVNGRLLAAISMVGLLGMGLAQAASGLPQRAAVLPDSDVQDTIRENALFCSLLTGISITLAFSGPLFGVDVDDINMNLLTRTLRGATGKQSVVLRLGGVVRANNNVEMILLDSKGSRCGRFFYGYRSGDLLFYDGEERLIIRGVIDSYGRFALSDLRLPQDGPLLVSGRFGWCAGCPGFDYSFNDRQGTLLARGLIWFTPKSSFPNGFDRIRTNWFADGGTLAESVPTYVEAEYDLRKEVTGALNSNLFDRRSKGETFFQHPYDLAPSPPGLAWVPRVTDATTISVVNDSSRQARVTLTASHYDGTPLSGPGIINPVAYQFSAGLQVTALPNEYFRGFSERGREPLVPPEALPFWVEITSDQPDLNVLYYDVNKRDMDGAAAARVAHREFLLDNMRGDSGARQEISMLNLSHSSATVRLEAYDAEGLMLGRADNLYVPARGFRNFLLGEFPDLFAGLDLSRLATLRAASTTNALGIVAARLSRAADGSLQMAQDRSISDSADVLWVPLFITGSDASGAWETGISITEAAGQDTSVLLEVFSTEGQLVTGYERMLRARGSASISVHELMETGNGPPSRGYLKVSSPGKLIGSVSFRCNSMTGTSASLLPLQPYPNTRFTFHQIIQGPSGASVYYTGLVLLNPLDDPAEVNIVAVDSEDKVTAQATMILPPLNSRIRLLEALFGAGFKQLGGSLRVIASRPVLSQALFGDTDGGILSAIPAAATSP